MLLISLCAAGMFLVIQFGLKTQYTVLCGSEGLDWQWKRQVPRQIYTMALVVLVLTSTVRYGFIDTYAYKEMYQLTRNDLNYVYSAPYGVESGWLLLCYYLNFITASPKIMLCLAALVINYVYLRSIRNHSCDPVFSVLIYFCLHYLDTNNGLRQMVASAIMILAFQVLPKKKASGYLLFAGAILLAMQLHESVVVCIPIAVAAMGKPFNLRTKAALVLGIVFLLFPGLLNDYLGEVFADSKYSNYLNYGEMGMSLPRAFIVGVLPSLLSAFYLADAKKKGKQIGAEEAFLLNMVFINTMFVLMGLYMQYWARFAFYTGFAPVILMPKLIHHMLKRSQSAWIKRIAIVCYVVFFAYNIYVNVRYGALDSFYIDL